MREKNKEIVTMTIAIILILAALLAMSYLMGFRIFPQEIIQPVQPVTRPILISQDENSMTFDFDVSTSSASRSGGFTNTAGFEARIGPDTPFSMSVIPRIGPRSEPFPLQTDTWFSAVPEYGLRMILNYQGGNEQIVDGFQYLTTEPYARCSIEERQFNNDEWGAFLTCELLGGEVTCPGEISNNCQLEALDGFSFRVIILRTGECMSGDTICGTTSEPTLRGDNYYTCTDNQWANNGELGGFCGVELPEEIVVYRFENNMCSAIQINPDDRLVNDYDSLEDCEINIVAQNFTNISIDDDDGNVTLPPVEEISMIDVWELDNNACIKKSIDDSVSIETNQFTNKTSCLNQIVLQGDAEIIFCDDESIVTSDESCPTTINIALLIVIISAVIIIIIGVVGVVMFRRKRG